MARLLLPPRKLARAVVLPPVVPEVPPDAVVSSTSELNAAINAIPANSGREWKIRLNYAVYGRITSLANFNGGTTRLRLQGSRTVLEARPVLRGFYAPNIRGVSFEFLNIVGDQMDEFGFPAGASGTEGARGFLLDNSRDVRIWGCKVQRWPFGIQIQNARDIEIGWTTVREFRIDGIRTFMANPNIGDNVRKHHVHITPNAESGTPYPDLSTRGLSYVNDRRCAIDPRRSDQVWREGDYANAPVMNLAGSMVPVSEGVRNGSHPDCDQTAGPVRRFTWEDCLYETNNLYCHGSYNNNNVSDGAGYATAGGLEYRRCEFRHAHNHTMAWQGDFSWGGGITLDTVLIRALPTRTYAVNIPGVADNEPVMRPGMSTRETINTVITSVNQSVVHTPRSSFWHDYSKVTGSIVQSTTEVPPGWELTDVARGIYGWDRAPEAPAFAPLYRP